MAKKDGVEIFELFRHGRPAATETRELEKAPVPRVASPPSAPPVASTGGNSPGIGDTVLSVRLNTAVIGLMVGAGCLFATFAMGVQYERRQHGADPSATGVAAGGDAVPPALHAASALPPIAREPRREIPPVAEPRGGDPGRAQVPPPVAEPKKGWSLLLMAYGRDDEGLAQRLLARVKAAGGTEASVVRNGDNWAVVAGFYDKQGAAEAQALLRKYQNMAGRLNVRLDLTWMSQTR
ncbi:MAG: SPOR domain-containing protein [Candidatus Brocadiae bacterium]|nr:SPOR domain-containing protein [Candidatus Brocadiia bacterium]